MNVHVFLGPTLPVEEAARILPARYWPPVACGDVLHAMADGPAAIGIIDGFFQQKPAVFHKEILFALSKGVRVFGASSMGALRAAELHPFGMEGVGDIFEAYRSGEIEDDDEVAIAHEGRESGFRARSEAMVNLRGGLRAARERGLISPATEGALLRIAKGMFYAERSWPRVLAAGAAGGLPEHELAALNDLVRRESPNAKRDDALALLRHMKRALDAPPEERPKRFELAETAVFEALEAAVRAASGYGRRASDDASPAALAHEAALFEGPDDTRRREALLYRLVQYAAPLLHKEATEAEIAEMKVAMGLGADEASTAVARLEVLARKMMTTDADVRRVAPYMPLVLLRRGELASFLERARSTS